MAEFPSNMYNLNVFPLSWANPLCDTPVSKSAYIHDTGRGLEIHELRFDPLQCGGTVSPHPSTGYFTRGRNPTLSGSAVQSTAVFSPCTIDVLPTKYKSKKLLLWCVSAKEQCENCP